MHDLRRTHRRPAAHLLRPAAPGVDNWIETDSPLVVASWPIIPPAKGAYQLHLNTNNLKMNHYAARTGSGAAEKQVLLANTPSGYIRAWREIRTTGPSLLVAACRENGVAPLECGAWAWVQSYTPVLLDPDGHPYELEDEERLFVAA